MLATPPADMAATVLGAVETHMPAAVSGGQHANALTKAGSLVAPGEVTLVHSGVRVCGPEHPESRENACSR
jgi:hypothetical protein